jgi:lipoteichoic acid synthase
VAWAAADDDQRPFFLTLLTVAPHHPYEVPGQRSRWLGETREQYLAAIHHQDRFLGAVLGELGRAGALDDAIVVILGDHGEAFGEHRRFQHDAVPYQEVTHVPLLVLGPEERIGPPRRVGGLRHHFDLVPTLLRLAGAGWEGALPGRDLFASPGHQRVFSSCWYPDYCLAMVEGEMKFVYHFGRRPLEAFDLARDPAESRNVADELPASRVIAARDRMAALNASVARFWAERDAAAPADEE